MRRLISLILLTAGLSSSAAAGPVHYTADTRDSLLYITVFKDESTIAAGISHDHAIRAATWSADMTVDPADLTTCRVSVRVPVAGLVLDEPWMRRAAGLEGELPESMKDTVRKNMLKEEQLHAEAHPTLHFTSTRCTSTTIEGDLTIRGVTRRVEMPATVRASDAGLMLSGALTIRATEFGFEPYSAMMGAVKNRDDMRLTVTLIGAADAATDAE